MDGILIVIVITLILFLVFYLFSRKSSKQQHQENKKKSILIIGNNLLVHFTNNEVQFNQQNIETLVQRQKNYQIYIAIALENESLVSQCKNYFEENYSSLSKNVLFFSKTSSILFFIRLLNIVMVVADSSSNLPSNDNPSVEFIIEREEQFGSSF